MDVEGLLKRPQTSPSFVIIMQTKTGAFLSMGRIPQLFGQAAVAAGLLAGGASLLNAGGAMAVTCPGPSVNAKYDAGNFLNFPLPQCDIESPLANNVAFNHFVAIENDFPVNLTNTSGVYQYSVSSLGAGNFLTYRLDYDGQQGVNTDFNITKEIFSDSGYNNLIGSVSNLTGLQQTLNLTNQSFSTIYVRDTYSVNANGVLDTVTNTFQTPGPLPILGAGAAFGFSRKLRSRIKAARTA
jgi:hypothetical protein